PAHWYARGLDLLNAVARLQTRVLQHGYLRIYLMVIHLVLVGLVGLTLVTHWDRAALPRGDDVGIVEATLVAIIAVAMLYVLRARSRLAAVGALGGGGCGVVSVLMVC